MSNFEIELEAKVGPVEAADGDECVLRLSGSGAVVITHAHGKRAEDALLGFTVMLALEVT